MENGLNFCETDLLFHTLYLECNTVMALTLTPFLRLIKAYERKNCISTFIILETTHRISCESSYENVCALSTFN